MKNYILQINNGKSTLTVCDGHSRETYNKNVLNAYSITNGTEKVLRK